MPNVLARIWNQQSLAYCPHTSVSGDTWQFIKSGTTTSAGASNGTTLIDTNGDSGGADTYNGAYWVRILSGTNDKMWRRIVDDDGSGTLTLENNGFANQVASAVEYEIWLSPEPIVVVDSSSGETDMVDATRSEATVNSEPFWKDFYACPITGTHRGKKAKITGFTAGSGTFVLEASFGSGLTAGDVVVLRKFIEAGGISASLSENYHPRPMNRVNFSQGDGIVGARGGSFGFNCQIVPSGSLSAAASRAASSVTDKLFQACGLSEVIGTSMTVGAGSTTTAVTVGTGTWERVVKVGMMVIWNGNPTWVTAITDGGGGVDTLTVAPALPTAPASSDVLYATRCYEKTTSGDTYGVLIEWEVDGIRHIVTGCKGSVSVVDAAVPEFQFNFSVDHWVREIEAAPYNAGTAYTTAQPVLSNDRICWLDATKTNIGGFTATCGTNVGAKNVQGSFGINGRAGYQVTGYACGASFRELLASDGDLDQDLRWQVRTARIVNVVYGSHGGTFAVRIPVGRLVESPHPSEADGMAEVPNVIEAQDAGVANDGTPTSNKVPDWAIFLS